MFLVGRKVFGNFVYDEADHLIFGSLVLPVEPLIQFIDSVINVSFGLFLVLVFTGNFTPRLLVMVDGLRDPLAEFSYFHVKVEVNIEDFDEALDCGFAVLQVNQQACVGFDDVERDVFPELHVDLFHVQIVQTYIYQLNKLLDFIPPAGLH